MACTRESVASSVPRLALQANCMGSKNEPTEAVISMHLARIGVRATGRKSLSARALVFFGIGTIVDRFHEFGTVRALSRNWNSIVIMPLSCCLHSFNTLPPRPSGPGALPGLIRDKHADTSSSLRLTHSYMGIHSHSVSLSALKSHVSNRA